MAAAADPDVIDAVRAAARHAEFDLWRAVEAQHVVSTLRLVGHNAADQLRLESLLETSKPTLPEDAAGADYLIFTPFRYPSDFPSRFRAPGERGVFYGAEARRTACAEAGYWRWRFFQSNTGLRDRVMPAAPQTVFRARVAANSVDLRQPPFAARRDEWTRPDDYSRTQAFARAARAARAGAIRYESVRDPEHGGCAVVLETAAFDPKRRLEEQTWYLTVKRDGVVWQREGDGWVFEFST